MAENPVCSHQEETQRQTEKIQAFDFNYSYDNVEFRSVITTDQYRKGCPYKLFREPGRSKVSISFQLDGKGLGSAIVAVTLNHCGTNCYGVVDMFMNDVPYRIEYEGARWDNFGEQTFRIPGQMCVPGQNTFTIRLSDESVGVYWLSDARVELERDVVVECVKTKTTCTEKSEESYEVSPQRSDTIQAFDFNNACDSVVFKNVTTSDYSRKGRPYKVFSDRGRSMVAFSFQLDRKDLESVIVAITLNHCGTNCYGVVDMFMNDVPYRTGYEEARSDTFEEQTFRIPSELCVPGKNTFTIRLSDESPGAYWLSDARAELELEEKE